MGMKKVYTAIHRELNYCYVGCTESSLKVRVSTHRSRAHATFTHFSKRGARTEYTSNSLFHLMLRAHPLGWKWEVREENIMSPSAAIKENYWIDFYRKQGYHMLNERKSNQSPLCGSHWLQGLCKGQS